MNTDDKIKNIVRVMDAIEPGKLTLLTGSNGSGKSLVRKQICFRLARKIGNVDPRKIVVNVSMQLRTETNPNLGAMCEFMHDDPEDPTSLTTYSLINTLFNSFANEDNKSNKYLVIDEPEIGMSKESQLGFVKWLKEKLPAVLPNTYGMLIITHSEIIVEELKNMSVFLNMDSDCTADEWLNREIIPTDFEKLANDSRALYQAILNN